jgi:polyketide biosynthesis enoyl-CoA hydratase PksH
MELKAATPAVRLPARLDAASVERLARELGAAITSSARVVTLAGATEDVFCLGLGIGSAPAHALATHAFADVLLALHRAPKPMLALVDGQAIGGGLGIAASCDWVIATERSTFALPELLWGLVPAMIWPPVSDRMAPHVVRQWTLTAHTRAAIAAEAAGLVDEVIAPASMPNAARRAERMLARLEPNALARFREWARASRALSLPDALARGAAITQELTGTPTVRERWTAFAAGEAPWT